MSITNSNTTDRRVTRTDEIDLSQFSDMFPEGTLVNVSFRGTRDSFTIELERNGLRYLLEGAGTTAELTGVFGEGNPRKPETVPEWIMPVLEEIRDIREVSVY